MSIAIVAFTLAVFIVPRLTPAYQPRHGCFVFGLAGAITVGLASQSFHYMAFLITPSVGFGACSGAIYINASSVAATAKQASIMTLTRSIFPAAQFARRFSIVFTAWGVADLAAPGIAGALYEASSSFDGALVAVLIATLRACETITCLFWSPLHSALLRCSSVE